jgi:hypothetical protein
MGDPAYDREIVSDEQIGDAEVFLQAAEQVDDLRLYADVERADWFITDDESGLGSEGSSDGDALSLPTTQFMWMPASEIVWKSDKLKELAYALAPSADVAQSVDTEWFTDACTDLVSRVQTPVRVLKDHLHLFALAAKLTVGQGRERPTLEAHLTGCQWLDSQDRTSDGRLSGARLADKRQRLSGVERETDAVDGADGRFRAEASFDVEVDGNFIHVQHGGDGGRVAGRCHLVAHGSGSP